MGKLLYISSFSKQLFKNESNIAETRDKYGNMTLHDPRHSNCHVVKLVIDTGSDLEAKNSHGVRKTLLYIRESFLSFLI